MTSNGGDRRVSVEAASGNNGDRFLSNAIAVMADSVTLADIYALFQASQAEADRRFAESDRQLQDLKRIAAKWQWRSR